MKDKAGNRNEHRHPRPEDVHAGQTLRHFRLMKGLSQEKLARQMGLTFQQIQKYETGANRMAMSTLCRVCRVLKLSPLAFFWEDLHGLASGSALLLTEKEARFVRGLRVMPEDSPVRAGIRALIKAAGATDGSGRRTGGRNQRSVAQGVDGLVRF